MNSSDKAVGKLSQFVRNPETNQLFKLSNSAEKKVTNKFLRAVEEQSQFKAFRQPLALQEAL